MKKRISSLILSLILILSLFPFIRANIPAQAAATPATFSWDNATVYFLLTDRFNNGDTSNDHSYGRGLDQYGNVVQGVDPSATFHGGDFVGVTQKIEEGYFNDLGVNAIWISAPYEQIHGYVCGGDGNTFPHFAYHGYYVADYTQTDANFGTAAEFRTLVDSAHEHGIRVVLDIVMNHAGYSSLYDMNEFPYGYLNSGWQNHYFSYHPNNTTYHTFPDYSGHASEWLRWWGPGWIRAGLPGYDGEGSGDLQMSLAGLPDFKTESMATVSVPAFLQEKWTREGRLSAENNKLNAYFSRTGQSRTARNHLIAWLSDWVREYGVDGFRCDTAKHVEKAAWGALKAECVQALRTWKANNPTKKLDDLDFWMVGEAWDWNVNGSSGSDTYFTQGGFDSMLNFDTWGAGVLAPGAVANTYATYASKINNTTNFNALSFMSSHDSVRVTGDRIHLGSAFLLLPGGIQIYYGDETALPINPNYQSNGDHNKRADMNWGSMDTASLEHWQIVGQFRNNHVAVGAGTHAQISATSGFGFTRNYNKNGVTDKIAACIDAAKNQNVTLTVSSLWANGTTVVNAYDGSEAVVSGGTVTFNSGKNGTILVQEPDGSPVIALIGNAEFTGTQQLTVSLKNATDAKISVDGGNKFLVTDGSTFEIGATAYPGDTVKVVANVTNSIKSITKTFSFKKLDPNVIVTPPITHARIHIKPYPGVSAAPYVYMWYGSPNQQPMGGFPGTQLQPSQKDEEGLWLVDLPAVQESYNVILSGGSNQNQSENVEGLFGEVWLEVKGANYKPIERIVPVEPVDPLAALKAAVRKIKNMTPGDFTPESFGPLYALVAPADSIIALGEAALQINIDNMLAQISAAMANLMLAAPVVYTTAAGDTSISGTAAPGATVTVIIGGITHTVVADDITGGWSVPVPALGASTTFTVSAERDGISSVVMQYTTGQGGVTPPPTPEPTPVITPEPTPEPTPTPTDWTPTPEPTPAPTAVPTPTPIVTPTPTPGGTYTYTIHVFDWNDNPNIRDLDNNRQSLGLSFGSANSENWKSVTFTSTSAKLSLDLQWDSGGRTLFNGSGNNDDYGKFVLCPEYPNVYLFSGGANGGDYCPYATVYTTPDGNGSIIFTAIGYQRPIFFACKAMSWVATAMTKTQGIPPVLVPTGRTQDQYMYTYTYTLAYAPGNYTDEFKILRGNSVSSGTNDARWFPDAAQKGAPLTVPALVTPSPEPTPTTEPTPTPTPEPTIMYGDTNCDGRVTAADAALLLRYLVGLSDISPQGLINARVSAKTGLPTAHDASLILRYVVGIITRFPVEDM